MFTPTKNLKGNVEAIYQIKIKLYNFINSFISQRNGEKKLCFDRFQKPSSTAADYITLMFYYFIQGKKDRCNYFFFRH